MNLSLLLLGDNETGKTTTIEKLFQDNLEIATLIKSDISLYQFPFQIPLEEETKNINLTIWDSSGKIKDLNYFILINNVHSTLIFCNLLNNSSCNNLDLWKNIIDKYHPNCKVIIVGTLNKDKESENIDKNKLEVLEWCVQNDDIPFFEIHLDNDQEIRDMYKSVTNFFLDQHSSE